MARRTYIELSRIASQHGFTFEWVPNQGYFLWSSKLAPGIEAEYRTLKEAAVDIDRIANGINPIEDGS